MKKQLLFAALALTALAGCTSDEYVGDQSLLQGDGAISFMGNSQAITRADATGATAAGHLSNQFIVWGEKNETGENVGTAAGTSGRDGHLVFKNYVVDWVDNSAYTTTSNTKGWEYVGLKLNDNSASPATTTYSDHLTPNSGATEQTIKYWDYGASSYTFTAVSALPADITAGNVTITKTQTGATVYDKGYTVALNASANLDKLYFSERQPIASSDNKDRTQSNSYGGNVTFRFHNTASKVRVAMYETIPGYSVTINSFKVTDAASPAFSAMTTEEDDNFAANFVNNAKGTAGSMTVKYVSSGTTQNHPTVSFTPTSDAANILNLGTNLKGDVTIGTTITVPTYDKTDGDLDGQADYTSVFPKEDNTQNLKLKVCYTLTAVDNSGNATTGETIAVTDATAEIPAQYLKWKPGYAYTYIFKITDDKLYPITFDAVETVDEDGLAEFITTVSEPSITTFAAIYNNSGVFQTYQAGESDYEIPSGTDKLNIYATIMDNSSVVDFTLGTNVNVYKVSTSDADNFPVTEASVAEALAELSTGSKKITYTDVTGDASTNFGAVPTKVSAVPGEDGVDVSIKALKLSGVKVTGKYAIEYIKTAATYNTTSVNQTFADAAALASWEASNYKLYDNADGTTPATATGAEKTYYKRTSVKNVGKYAYKIITVTAAP